MASQQQQQQQVDGSLSPGSAEIEQQVDSSDETGNITIDEEFLLSKMGRTSDMDEELRRKRTPFTESQLEILIMEAERNERIAEELERQADEADRRADELERKANCYKPHLTSQQQHEIDDLLSPEDIEPQVDFSEGPCKVRLVVTKIEESFGKLAPEVSEYLSKIMAIYRVPQKLREGSDQYYTPRIVSIGPFHHGNKKYTAMEVIKLKSLQILLKESSQPLKIYVDKFKDYVDTARWHYSEKAVGKLQSNDNFLQMMLVDGAFIIKFMISYGVSNSHVKYDEADRETRIFLSPQDVSDVKHDLCLLENQLPFSFLKSLNMMFFHYQKTSSKIIWKRDLASLAAEIWPQLGETKRRGTREPRHFLDLLRDTKLPPQIYHDREPKEKQLKYRPIKSAKKLRQAGVKVQGVVDIYRREFATFKGNGNLKISTLDIDDTSLVLYKNIMALEQCRYPKAQHVSDYLILMEMLIRDGSEELLLRNRVIVNNLTTDSTTAASVLGELCKNISYSSHPFGMGDVCKDVTEYCNSTFRKLRAGFNGKSWQIGGAIILLLTFVQTLFTALEFFGVAFK